MNSVQRGSTRRISAFGIAVFVSALLFVFVQSQLVGGYTWDEGTHLHGLKLQLAVAADWFQGDAGANFRRLPSDLAFYGTISIFPAHAAGKLAEWVLNADGRTVDAITHYSLHATAFACGLLSLLLAYLILARMVANHANAVLGSILLALFPMWLGYTFFDFKDVPTAAFALMALFAAIGLMESGSSRTRLRFAALLGLATVLIAGTKIAALALILPSWVVAIVVLLRAGMLSSLVVLSCTAIAGIMLITPVAWPSPISFVIAAVELMSRHAWAGCTMTAGDCLGPHSADWSALRYLGLWLGAQIPLTIMAGIAISPLLLLLRRQSVPMLVAISIALPLALIVIRNSTLYDGLRHVLFVVPMIFILAVWAFDQLAEMLGRARRWVPIALSLQAAMFVSDNVAMFPYNYVYFNMAARQFADHANFETEYWGFSLKQAARSDAMRTSDARHAIADPAHLANTFLPASIKLVEPKDVNELPPETPVLSIKLTRLSHTPAPGCASVEWIERRLPFSARTLRLAFVATCEARQLSER